MGQKILPKNFRLQYTKTWNSQWITSNIDYSSLFIINYYLEQYFKIYATKFLLNLANLKIKQLQRHKFIIYVFIHNQHNKRAVQNTDFYSLINQKDYLQIIINKFCKQFYPKSSFSLMFINVKPIKLKLRKKLTKFFFQAKGYRFLPRNAIFFFSVISASIYTKNVQLLTSFLVKNLQRIPFHRQYLIKFNVILQYFFKRHRNFIGYKIQWSGRLNGAERARKLTFQSGQIPLNTITKNIQYDCQEVITRAGVCSLKIWFLFT